MVSEYWTSNAKITGSNPAAWALVFFLFLKLTTADSPLMYCHVAGAVLGKAPGGQQ